MPFAAVVVNVAAPGLRQPFTYKVPDALAGSIVVGSCVVAPFGKREAVGYVVGLSDTAPPDLDLAALKEIIATVSGDGAALPAAVLQTARWMAREYGADLAQCVRCVVPESQTAHVVRRRVLAYDWQSRASAPLPPAQKRLLDCLLSFPGGTATDDEIQNAVGENVKIAAPLSALRRGGIVEDRWEVEPPRTRARAVRVVRLLCAWDAAETEAVRRETKAPAQARLLRTLAKAGGGPMPASEAAAEAGATPGVLKRLETDGFVEILTVEMRRRPFRLAAGASVAPVPTDEQNAALEQIKIRLDTGRANVALLYGVTGSGKTEVYLRSIGETRRRGRTSLVLVPEIALTAQVVDSFRARLGEKVAVLHSGLSDGERRDEWQRIARGEADVVVGARSAAFAPLDHVGLIVVDEEHEGSYKQDNPAPRYHARDVAVARARATGATVILGSATPALETFWKATEGGEWGLLPLRERANARAALPSVEIVDLRESYQNREKGSPPPALFSPVLHEAIADRLAKREQTILFLNRRGFARFLLCRDCGYTTHCPNCDVSLTYYAGTQRLVCHHCGYVRPAPTLCPSCAGDRIRPFGLGTEKVEAETRRLFPDARVLRMDRDTTLRKDAHVQMLRTFRNGEADILIGTQMVAKGLDFAGVTLVGVVSADTALNLPDFRASERAFQLLTQVSGRAGRGRKPGHVIVQTFCPEHESVAAAARHDYDTFYTQEIAHRRELAYPPFTRLANIIATDDSPREAENRLHLLASRLGGREASFSDGAKIGGDDELMILGPSPCPLGRLRNRYRWHLLLKAPDADLLRRRLRHALAGLSTPERMGLSIDIDPMSLL